MGLGGDVLGHGLVDAGQVHVERHLEAEAAAILAHSYAHVGRDGGIRRDDNLFLASDEADGA